MLAHVNKNPKGYEPQAELDPDAQKTVAESQS